MCRYAYKTYKPHFVCFACRKQFKRPPLRDLLEERGKLDAFEKLQNVYFRKALRESLEKKLGTSIEAMRSEMREIVSRCPQCRAPMADMGLDFKPPRMSNVKAWERIRAMYRLGHSWHTCGCSGPGFVPVDASGFADYLASRERLFAERLKTASNDPKLSPGERAVEVGQWTSLLESLSAVSARAKAGRISS
jgi:hypothetical protein